MCLFLLIKICMWNQITTVADHLLLCFFAFPVRQPTGPCYRQDAISAVQEPGKQASMHVVIDPAWPRLGGLESRGCPDCHPEKKTLPGRPPFDRTVLLSAAMSLSDSRQSPRRGDRVGWNITSELSPVLMLLLLLLEMMMIFDRASGIVRFMPRNDEFLTRLSSLCQ